MSSRAYSSGRRCFGWGDVAQVFGGGGEQVRWWPVGGGDGGDQGRPGGVGDDGFGDAASRAGGAGRPSRGVAAECWRVEGGRCQGAGQAPPQRGGGQFVGQRPVAFDRRAEQVGDVGAGAGGVVEVGGQPGPERVGGEVRVDAVGQGAPALCGGLAAADCGVDAGVDELLYGRGAVGVLVGSGDAGVGGIDVVGGAKHRDLGEQLGLVGAAVGAPMRARWRAPIGV